MQFIGRLPFFPNTHPFPSRSFGISSSLSKPWSLPYNDLWVSNAAMKNNVKRTTIIGKLRIRHKPDDNHIDTKVGGK